MKAACRCALLVCTLLLPVTAAIEESYEHSNNMFLDIQRLPARLQQQIADDLVLLLTSGTLSTCSPLTATYRVLRRKYDVPASQLTAEVLWQLCSLYMTRQGETMPRCTMQQVVDASLTLYQMAVNTRCMGEVAGQPGGGAPADTQSGEWRVLEDDFSEATRFCSAHDGAQSTSTPVSGSNWDEHRTTPASSWDTHWIGLPLAWPLAKAVGWVVTIILVWGILVLLVNFCQLLVYGQQPGKRRRGQQRCQGRSRTSRLEVTSALESSTGSVLDGLWQDMQQAWAYGQALGRAHNRAAASARLPWRKTSGQQREDPPAATNSASTHTAAEPTTEDAAAAPAEASTANVDMNSEPASGGCRMCGARPMAVVGSAQPAKLFKCSRCRSATDRYCSRACQKADWARHKHACKAAGC